MSQLWLVGYSSVSFLTSSLVAINQSAGRCFQANNFLVIVPKAPGVLANLKLHGHCFNAMRRLSGGMGSFGGECQFWGNSVIGQVAINLINNGEFIHPRCDNSHIIINSF